MNARAIVTIGAVALLGCLHAQMSPMFETTIYVEDAIGNLDSVVIGYDLDANGEYNPQFGEFDIAEPFDSIFEVRAGHSLDYNGLQHDIVLSKRIVGGVEGTGYIPGEDCYAGREPIILFIWALHKPVMVYWDSAAFDETWCTRGSMISSHNAHLAVGPWWVDLDLYESSFNLVGRTTCMAESDSFADSLTWREWPMGILQPVEGSGIDTVFGIMVTALHQESALADWCGDGIVRLHETENITPVAVFPNPVTDMLYFEKEVSSYVLFDVDGKVVRAGKHTSVVDMSRLQRGFYLLRIVDGASRPVSMKIVKQ